MGMKVYRTDKIIKRKSLQENPTVLYVFGDNDVRTGLGGQAKEMRGELNSFGISTKKAPNNKEESFKTDEEYVSNCLTILEDIHIIKKALIKGNYRALVIPVLGVGMAKLPEKAPRTYQFLKQQLDELQNFAENYG